MSYCATRITSYFPTGIALEYSFNLFSLNIKKIFYLRLVVWRWVRGEGCGAVGGQESGTAVPTGSYRGIRMAQLRTMFHYKRITLLPFRLLAFHMLAEIFWLHLAHDNANFILFICPVISFQFY